MANFNDFLMINGIAIASLVVAILASAIVLIQFRMLRRSKLEDSRIRLAVDAPEVLYTWNSNYVYLRYSFEPGEPVTEALVGKFALINKSNATLSEVRVSVYAGSDQNLLKYPYSTEVKAIRICENNNSLLEPGKSVELDVIKGIREAGFDIYNLPMTNELPLAKLQNKDWSQLSKQQREFGIGLSQLEGVVLDSTKHKIYGIYLRAYVDYFYQTQNIRHCLQGFIGYQVPLDTGSPGMVVSTFTKARKSVHTSPNGVTDVINCPQIVHDSAGVENAKLPRNVYIFAIRASGKENNFTMWLKTVVKE